MSTRIKIDPKLNTDINDLEDHKPEIVFICLPTPMNDDGSQNISIVDEVIKKIYKFDQEILIVIKHDSAKLHTRYFKTSQNVVINPSFCVKNLPTRIL